VLLALFILQLGRLACAQSQEPEPLGPAAECRRYVQLGDRRGIVICLDGGLTELAAQGVSSCCMQKLSGETLRSGDVIQCERRAGGCELRLDRMSPVHLATLGVVLDLNIVTARELTSIHGVGEEMARRIVSFRDAHGRFRDVQGLLAVPGVGAKKLKQMRHRLRIGAPRAKSR
jgi:competence ComEA-like helix-hairpin-helix protein